MKYDSESYLVAGYLDAKEYVTQAGYGAELDWQQQRDVLSVDERDFLRELAWVVLSCGMSERVVRAKFSGITAAFCNWRSAEMIVRHLDSCRQEALAVFGHKGKIDSILTAACIVDELGFEQVHHQITERGVEYLRSFDYVGPVTAFHLAKNLGLDVAKPDRHLARVAASVGFETPAEMCAVISGVTGDRVSVVDLVIWRFATLRKGYESVFRGTGTA